jgi:hypothetical protein
MEICRLGGVGWLLISMALWLGCGGDSSGRYAITGTVTLDGAPLDKGNISFQPTEGAKTTSGAIVNAGSFSIPKDKGLLPGKYRVEVYAAAPGGGGAADADAPPGEGPPPPKELVPPDWNEESKQTIEVKKEGPFKFSFEIATKGK